MDVGCWQPVGAHGEIRRARAEKYSKSRISESKVGRSSRIMRKVWEDDWSSQ